jgi:methyl-accepting chemotaxis protein
LHRISIAILFSFSHVQADDGKAARVSTNEKLASLKSDYSYYDGLILADGEGTIIASSSVKVIGKINIKDRAYFKSAMAGNAFVSDAAIGFTPAALALEPSDFCNNGVN